MAVEGCGAKLSKLLLFIFNFLLLVCGAALLGVGSYVMAKQADYQDLFEEQTLVIVAGIIIGVGCFTFVVSFCGCCGAMKENVCLLKMYFFFIVLIILAEIVGAILAFVYSSEIEKSMRTGMTDAIHNSYGIKDGTTKAVDDVQRTFDCCGATNYTDYKQAKGLTNGSVPASCCKPDVNVTLCTQGAKGEPTNTTLVQSAGCVDESINTVKNHYWIIGIVALCLLVFEILTMVFACCVINGIQKGYETV